MYRIWCSIIIALTFSTIVWAEQIFREENLGIEFNYDDTVSLKFNPHAMPKIPIYYGSIYTGGLVVSVFPPDVAEDGFFAYGVTKYEVDYGIDNVIYSKRKNDQGLEYHHYAVSTQVNGNATTIERAIYVQSRPSGPMRESTDFTYTFNFRYEGNAPAPSLGKIVSSFTIFENDPAFNSAMLRVVDSEVYQSN